MNVTIDQNGQLIIQAENALESYALNKWIDSNFSKANATAIDTKNILIKTGVEKP